MKIKNSVIRKYINMYQLCSLVNEYMRTNIHEYSDLISILNEKKHNIFC
jgi:translation initiation factor 2 beta subunit (eIF-2beta)/eIF-5